MTWTFELIQLKDNDNNLLPLWKVTQWNTDNPNKKWETTITDKVKIMCYD